MIVTHYLLFLFICTATLFQLISINLFSHIHSIQYCLTPVQFLSLFTVFTLLMVFADTETLIPLKSPAYFCNVCNLLHNHTALLVCILFIYLYYVIYNGFGYFITFGIFSVADICEFSTLLPKVIYHLFDMLGFSPDFCKSDNSKCMMDFQINLICNTFISHLFLFLISLI